MSTLMSSLKTICKGDPFMGKNDGLGDGLSHDKNDGLNDGKNESLNYKAAGVDIEVGDQLVDWLKHSTPASPPHAHRLVSGIGGFAAVFRAGFPEMKSPCLVTSTDGIGTKIKLASDFQKYDTVGQDLVAMCVNDVICAGARPLFFLDYYATGKLQLEAAKEFLAGVRRACHESDCALIGGETAEMPGVYQGNDFDAAGFAVGVVDEDECLGPHRVTVGAHVIGVSSSGFHANGYSLLRKVFANDLERWRDQLLAPTHLYTKLVLDLGRAKLVQAVAHITGGGTENIPRVLPKGTVLPLLDWAWPTPFVEVQDRTGLSRVEMLKTLNCGIGLVLIVAPEHSLEVERRVRAHGYGVHELGKVERGGDPGAEAEILY